MNKQERIELLKQVYESAQKVMPSEFTLYSYGSIWFDSDAELSFMDDRDDARAIIVMLDWMESQGKFPALRVHADPGSLRYVVYLGFDPQPYHGSTRSIAVSRAFVQVAKEVKP